ncbi:MAG: PQQ-dependent sugar dehydrogenase [Pseudomonadota bacterium]
MIRTAAALSCLTLAAACNVAADVPAPTPEVASDLSLTLTEVASGLEFPWGLAALPGGDLLVTEREGRLRILRGGALDAAPLGGLPEDIYVDRQGGLLDVALHPDFDTNRMVYLTYSQGDREANRTVVIRGALNSEATALEGVEEIFAAHMPEKTGGAHFGSRIAFLPDGALIVTTGDGYRWMDEAQVRESHFGKVLRMTDTGAPLPDNPFFDEGGPAQHVWSLGHRNVQGLAFNPDAGLLYAHEHGPKGGDELNIIQAGTNYGWPEITYGVDYDGSIISPDTQAEGLAQPETYWVPSIAPSGMIYYTGDRYPAWQGDLLIGAMQGPAGRKLVRVDLDEAGQVIGREDLLVDAGEGYRDLEVASDGALYLATVEFDGKIYRLDLAE